MLILQDEIGLKEWATSLRTAHKMSLELLSNMARKAGKIYGTDSVPSTCTSHKPQALVARNGN